jgi:hypothetical protein
MFAGPNRRCAFVQGNETAGGVQAGRMKEERIAMFVDTRNSLSSLYTSKNWFVLDGSNDGVSREMSTRSENAQVTDRSKSYSE